MEIEINFCITLICVIPEKTMGWLYRKDIVPWEFWARKPVIDSCRLLINEYGNIDVVRQRLYICGENESYYMGHYDEVLKKLSEVYDYKYMHVKVDGVYKFVDKECKDKIPLLIKYLDRTIYPSETK